MSVSDEIKQRIDIVDYVSRYTPLRKTGASYKGLCPFHNERTPSFVVFPHTGTWHCFGACGTGGDVFAFLMKKENLEFREALQILAQEAGVELDDGPSTAGQSRRARIYEADRAAMDYFQKILSAHPTAKLARNYLANRGIDQSTIDNFQLGYSLDQWSGLRDHLLKQGYELDLLLAAGLIKHNQAQTSTYDAFRARLIIPIRDRMGRIIGFGGRVLDDSQPKYLNTAETDVFHKSHVVYGLDMAHQAIHEANKVVIVEGYMDVIAAHQFGFSNVVACMGTALTPEQLQQLQRYSSDYVLALDADAAGQQATIRGLNQARQALTRIRKPIVTRTGVRIEERLGAALFIAAMPEGRDPDDVIRQNRAEWEQLIEQAKPLVDFYFSIVAAEVDLESAQGKGAAVAELAPLIAELDDEIEREHYVQQLARLVQIDERTIAARVLAAARTNRVDPNKRATSGNARFGTPRRNQADGSQPQQRASQATTSNAANSQTQNRPTRPTGKLNAEEYLLAHMLHEPELLIWLADELDVREIRMIEGSDWEQVDNREIFDALQRYMSSDSQWDLEMFQEILPPSLHGQLGRLMSVGAELPQNSHDSIKNDLLKVLVRLRLDRLKARSLQVKYLIDEATRSGERDDARELFVLNDQVLRDLSHLQRKLHQLSQVLVSQGRAELGVTIRSAAQSG